MAVIDLVLGLLKVVTIVYDIVTFPIYGITQQSWKERTKQNLGAVSILLFNLYNFSIINSSQFFEYLLKMCILEQLIIQPNLMYRKLFNRRLFQIKTVSN